MATPISYGLVLDGDDARDFEKYIENPTFTEKGLKLMQRVVKELKEEGFEE